MQKLLEDEEKKMQKTDLESDIQKLMKAIVAQRKQIESLEKDKYEQSQTIQKLEDDRE